MAAAPLPATGFLPVLAIVAALYFMPASLPYLFGVSSFAVGVVVSLIMAWVIYGMGWTQMRPAGNGSTDVVLAIGVAFFVVLHLVVASQLGEVDFARALASLGVLLFVIISASLVADIVFSTSAAGLAKAMRAVAIAFVIIGILGVAGLQPPTQSVGEKPIFPYTEPSFYAFTFAPVLFYLAVSSSLWLRLMWLALTLALALILSNLTLLVVALLAAVISLPVTVLGAGAFLALSYAGLVDLTYFTDRIDFSLSTTNLSTLVYIQGWQLLDESITNTWGWGLGFQQLGFTYTNVSASIRLNQLLGFDLNLADGGFVLAKIGSEFGVFGLIIGGTLLYYSIRSFIYLRILTYKRVVGDARLVFAHATMAAAAVELLIRGANYFTGSLVMVLAAFFFFARTARTAAGPAT